MKRIFKLAFKAVLRLTSPVRRPIMARVDARLSALVSGTVNARMMPPIIEALAVSGHRLERIEATLARADRSVAELGGEIDLVLNGLSREIFRLQAQVDGLREALREDARDTVDGLSIVDETGEDLPVRRPGVPDRSRVG